MKVIKPRVILSLLNKPKSIMRKIEIAARTCYKSEDKINETSHVAFIERLVRRGHEAMLEHGYATAYFRVDRGVSHELVRHRLASFAQESTRYCNYKDKDIEFVEPSTELDVDSMNAWSSHMQACEVVYNNLIKAGHSPQVARAVLPNSLATDLVVTANLREWRTIFKLRCAKDAHPDMRYIMIRLLSDMYKLFPPVFEDIYQLYKEEVDALNRTPSYIVSHSETIGADA